MSTCDNPDCWNTEWCTTLAEQDALLWPEESFSYHCEWNELHLPIIDDVADWDVIDNDNLREYMSAYYDDVVNEAKS